MRGLWGPMGPQEGAWVRAHRPQPLSPSPLSSLGGNCSPAVFLPQGWDEPTLRKGLWGPRPPAHPRSLVVLNIFKHTHTHTHTHLHGGFVTRAHPNSATMHSQAGPAKQKQKQKHKIDLLASPLPQCFGHFPVCSASPRTPGLPLSLEAPRFRPLVREVGRWGICLFVCYW